MDNANELKHWVVIKVWDKLGGNVLELMRWDDLPWNIRVKFNWYFTYRAALLQVKYPRAIIDHRWGKGNERSKTFPGIASAMATQWSKIL